MATITNLKGTTWLIRSGAWENLSPATYDVGGYEYCRPDHAISTIDYFDQFRVGYCNDVVSKNYICFYDSANDEYDSYVYDSSFGYLYITFTSGKDLTNSSLISWLNKYATGSVTAGDTSCANTVWTITNAVSSPSGYYSMNGRVTKRDGTAIDFTEFAVGYGRLEGKYPNSSGFDSSIGSVFSFWNRDTKEWLNVYSENDLPLTIHFYDGLSANQINLNSWLETNGTQGYALSGRWFLDYNPALVSFGETINFTSNSFNFDAISSNGQELLYSRDSEIISSPTIAYGSAKWNDFGYRIVDFGSTPQTVSQEFYDAFTSIAKPVPTDLTNTTWNVKAGWEAESAFLSFGWYQESVGILNGKDIYDLNIGYGTSTETSAPYDSIEPMANSITYHAYNYSHPHFSVNNTTELLFVFGNSAIANDLYTNTSLITWLCTYGDLTKRGEAPDTPTDTPTEAISIRYNGKILATIGEGETITLHTNGKKALTDIVISVGASNLISFTIDGKTYYAQEGMTWGEWFNSEYNTDNYSYGNPNYTIRLDNVQITETDLIVANGAYTKVGGGADD